MSKKVTIVTGASSGIGLGIARALIARGHDLVATARSITTGGVLPASPLVALVDGDIGDPTTAARLVDVALTRFGRIDTLVNNAGIFQVKPFTDYTADDIDRLLATNLAGFVHTTRAVLPHMVARRSGHIVNLGTSLAGQPIAGVPSAMPILIKGGIEAATRSLAIEYADRGIRVNTVSAGIVDTPMHPREHHEFLASLSPAGRIGQVAEIVDAVLYLDGAGFVSGEVLHVDGGAHAGRW
jgi:NAD(P)-dependent dehydrogenase (short-subunit alcohol dehydrogenase family)